MLSGGRCLFLPPIFVTVSNILNMVSSSLAGGMYLQVANSLACHGGRSLWGEEAIIAEAPSSIWREVCLGGLLYGGGTSWEGGAVMGVCGVPWCFCILATQPLWGGGRQGPPATFSACNAHHGCDMLYQPQWREEDQPEPTVVEVLTSVLEHMYVYGRAGGGEGWEEEEGT